MLNEACSWSHTNESCEDDENNVGPIDGLEGTMKAENKSWFTRIRRRPATERQDIKLVSHVIVSSLPVGKKNGRWGRRYLQPFKLRHLQPIIQIYDVQTLSGLSLDFRAHTNHKRSEATESKFAKLKTESNPSTREEISSQVPWVAERNAYEIHHR